MLYSILPLNWSQVVMHLWEFQFLCSFEPRKSFNSTLYASLEGYMLETFFLRLKALVIVP